MVVLLITTSSLPAFAASPAAMPSLDAGWLETLNYYRVSSGVDPVKENPAQSAAAFKHSIYLAKSDPSFFTGQYQNPHTENPSSPYYTAEGAKSGTNLTSVGRESEAIDSWMTAPLHTIGLIRDNLRTTGFASVLNERTGYHETGLDVINGLVGPRTKVVTFPGNNAVTRLYSFGGETPDPRESCGRDWKEFSGLPILASFLSSPPRDISVKLKTPQGQELSASKDICLVTEHNWVSSDRIITYGDVIMKQNNLVIAIPRNPLESGIYEVTLQSGSANLLSWKFTVVLPPPVVKFSFNTSTESISWQPSKGPEGNSVNGYTVMAFNDQTKKTNSYRTSDTTFSTFDWEEGKYWICIRARGQISESECSSYWGYTLSRKPNRPLASFNGEKLTWSIQELANPASAVKNLFLTVTKEKDSEPIISREFQSDVNEFVLPKLDPGEYRFCLISSNNYGKSECVWQYFYIPKNTPTLAAIPQYVFIEDKFVIKSNEGIELSVGVLTPKTCKSSLGTAGYVITALKEGSCQVSVSSEETSFWNYYDRFINVRVMKKVQISSIVCRNGKKSLTVTAVNPQCPKGYIKKN